MSKLSWIGGFFAAAILVGFTAIAQDPPTRRPTRDLEARVQNLEESFLEQQARLRNVTIALNEFIQAREPIGIQPGPETKGKFDSPVKIVEVSREFDLMKLDNGFAVEIAKDSIKDMTSTFKGLNIELYATGTGPYPYKILVLRPSQSPVTLSGRLIGRP